MDGKCGEEEDVGWRTGGMVHTAADDETFFRIEKALADHRESTV